MGKLKVAADAGALVSITPSGMLREQNSAYASLVFCRWVLEVNEGVIEENSIRSGDKITFK